MFGGNLPTDYLEDTGTDAFAAEHWSPKDVVLVSNDGVPNNMRPSY